MLRSTLIIGSLCLAVGAVVLVARGDRRPDSPPSSLVGVPASVDTNPREHVDRGVTPRPLGLRRAAPVDERAVGSEASVGELLAAREPPVDAGLELRDAINERWTAESRDPTSTADDIVRALEPRLGDGTRLADVECRTSLCAIQVTHDSVDDFLGFPERLPMSAPFDVEIFVAADDEDPTRSTVFLARPGHRLPGVGGST